MSEIVSTFSRVKIGDFNYLFFVIAWNDYMTPMREELNRQLMAFGQQLSIKGKVVTPYNQASDRVYQEILKKNWTKGFRESLKEEHEPFMLIIDVDFEEFDPQQHRWAIVRFSDYPVAAIPKIFHQLAMVTRKNENIFRYLQVLMTTKNLGKAASYFEIKPEIFGVSINVSAIIEDLTQP